MFTSFRVLSLNCDCDPVRIQKAISFRQFQLLATGSMDNDNAAYLPSIYTHRLRSQLCLRLFIDSQLCFISERGLLWKFSSGREFSSCSSRRAFYSYRNDLSNRCIDGFLISTWVVKLWRSVNRHRNWAGKASWALGLESTFSCISEGSINNSTNGDCFVDHRSYLCSGFRHVL